MANNLKKQVSDWIAVQDYPSIVAEAAKGSDKCLRYAQMNVWYDAHQPMRWYAITALEQLANAYSKTEEETYRNVIRRAVWAMSDESGNVPWAAPEMMAAVIQSNPNAFGNFVPILISNGMDNPMCHAGVLWSVGYLGKSYLEQMDKFMPKLLKCLNDKNDEIRGMAVWAFRKLDYEPAEKILDTMGEDGGITWVYEDGVLQQTTIRELLA